MEHTKYTPNPWIADEFILQDDDGILTIFIWGPEGEGYGRVGQAYAECGHEDELRPNAILQAAAPELLEALEAFVREHDCEACAMGDDDSLCECKLCVPARAAIAKARGR